MTRFEALVLSSALVLAGGCSGSVGSTPVAGPSSRPASPIQHIVILMQENRSFNNLFAGFPGADTAMQGLCKPNPPWCRVAREVPLKGIALAQGSPAYRKDVCHSHQCYRLECDLDKTTNVCRNDGFDLVDIGESQGGQPAKLYAYSYVKRSEVAAYWKLARQYAIADRMFFTESASSFIAHQSILSGTAALDDFKSETDQPDTMPWGCDAPFPVTATAILFRNGYVNEFGGPFPCFTWATIADLLDARNVAWRFYVDSFKPGRNFDASGETWNGFDAIRKVACPSRHSSSTGPACNRGKDWVNVSIPNTNVFKDLKGGTLPSVSWVIPTLNDSDHPGSACNGGPRWVTQVVNAIGTSAYWRNTAIILLWDDWGGWYDNVPPPQITYSRLGFRVPMIVISPYAKPHTVAHTQYDFGSILKFIEQTFGLGSLGTTDATANSMEDVFDFSQPSNVFHPAPLPHADKCASQLVEPDEAQEIVKQIGPPG
jgi:phospholipase C